MNWNNVRLIFLREVRDQLRDRRTLFMIAVLPLLLYPALGIGMVQMTVLFTEQPRTVLILGSRHLPDFCTDCAAALGSPGIPTLLDGNRFRSDYFRVAEDAERLRVVTDRNADEDAESLTPRIRRLLRRSDELRANIIERESVEDENSPRKRALNRQLSRMMAEARVQVVILVPEGFAKKLETVNRRLSAGSAERPTLPEYDGLIVLRNSADEKSLIAYRRTKEALHNWEKAVLKDRLRRARLPEHVASPVAAAHVEVAEEHQISANLWSKLFPALLVIMAVTGAFYPAVDVVAGEKERGTMETLLICPAKRVEIVLGKFFTVMAFSMCTALLNLISMGLTGKYIVSVVGAGATTQMGGLAAPGLAAIFWVILLLIPLAALFSALSLALATFAKSSKEGQYYLTPLLIVTLGMTVFCLSPAVQMEPFYSVMPIVGPTLLLKELLSSTGSSAALLYALPVLVTSVGYSALALWWAIEQFVREDILFREAERFDLRLWARHLLRDKEPTPSFAEAGFCFVMIMLLQFGAMKFMGEVLAGTSSSGRSTVMMQLLMVQQLVIIATPAVMMGVVLTSNPRRTFRLYWPGWKFLGTACLLAVVLHPLTLELSALLQRWFFLPLPKNVTSQFGIMSDSAQSLGLVLLAFALVPAVCEELAFRGLILSGFEGSRHKWVPIVLSAAAFGLMHMIPQQVFNAALLGVVLGLLAVRSNSLFPAVAFHVVYNSLAVGHGRLGNVSSGWWKMPPMQWFVTVGESGLRYEPLLLVLCAVPAVWLLKRLMADDTGENTVFDNTGETAPAEPEHLADPPVAVKS